ncbi:MAG TPA: AarF/UbiB family protein [Dongiaceae bacterium]|nr:AarF/UbiB family protein [Dongiaceae bacterium]
MIEILKAGKDLRRLNELSNILIKYGFGDLIRRMGLAETLERAGKLIRYQMSEDFLHLQPPERARRAMEEMGPTLIKLGQILATRVDLFPPEWITEFGKLQDEVPPVPFADLQPQVERSLGQPLNRVFRTVDERPLGTASMAQVHRATTVKGEKVVLKIRKPNISDKIEADLRLLKYVAKLAESQSFELKRYSPFQIVREFERSLLRELDFSVECKNAERIAHNLRRFDFVKIPRIYWEWTCEDLNVQEFIDGIPARNVREIDAAGLDRKLIARRGAKVAWHMMLVDGFFHADPHPGNILVLPKNQIAILDFGMVGKLSNTRRDQLMKLVRHAVFREIPAAVRILQQWSNKSGNFEQLVSECDDFMQQYYGVPLDQINVPQLITQAADTLREHDIALPPDIAMLAKTCITLEGFGRLLYPQFDLMQEGEELIKLWGKERYKPGNLVKKLGLRAFNYVDGLFDEDDVVSPADYSTSLNGIDRGLVERLAKRQERLKYRQIQLMVAVGALLSSTLLMLLPEGPKLWGMHVVGIVLFLGSVVSIQWLLFLLWWGHRSTD